MNTTNINQRTKKLWSKEEIDILKSEFAKGKSIKLIASMLNRSETAVNKFLSRAGIRKRRWSISPKSQNRITSRFFANQNKLKAHCYKTMQSFDDVIRYLRSAGYLVRSTCPNEYSVNGDMFSKTRVLLLANRLRALEFLPMFDIPCICQ